ncbi:MAG TPA: energy transducer TonB [Pyrinomonadaceae bacterium]|nr:energy transducer TonB [Pyrinomonadaceae bacterium]
MGKIVKYCAACEEGFAEKFAFCPNCGGALTAYELNPLTTAEKPATNISQPAAAITAAAATENLKAETVTPETVFAAENKSPEAETVAFSTDKEEKLLDDEFLPEETAAANGNGNGFYADNFSERDQYQPANFQSPDNQSTADADAGGFHVTVIEEKNSGIRNALLLGACAFVITMTLAGVVYSLFTKELYAAGLSNTELVNAMVVDDIPAEVEEEPKKNNKEKGGGGGGGGKQEDEDVSKGTPPRQTKEQLDPPTSKIPQMENPALPKNMSTQGDRDVKRTEQPIGSEYGQSAKLSDGRGSGGGMGSGSGTGFGGGRGTGNGNGIGSGNGNGNGDGDGDGDGDGSGGGVPPPLKKPKPPEPVGPTEGVKILSKPRANYTDAARTQGIQGVVRVRVTFLANGSIGGITPVSNLGYGLTEQAVAAARSIRFEPAKKGGVPYSVTKVVEYSFTLY